MKKPHLFSAAQLIVLAIFHSVQAAPSNDLPPTPPFLMNCGPSTDESPYLLAEAHEQRSLDRNRIVLLPDMPRRDASEFGHGGGEGYHHWHGACRASLGPNWNIDMFSTGRVAPESYSFAIPDGHYYVTVGLCEGDVHVAGQRVFDVLVNGKRVAAGIDPLAMAGYKEPLMLSANATVSDGRPLTVTFRAKTERQPIVSAIWVTPAASDARQERRLAAPSNVRVVGSYLANLLSWQRPDDFRVAGFLIRRRNAGDEDFTIVTPELIYAHRWIDRDVKVGEVYAYQVGSRNEQGDVRWSATLTAQPKPTSDSAIPIYSIHLPPGARSRMLANVHRDHTELGTLRAAGTDYAIEMRIRGASTRHAAKKSYRIRFRGDRTLPRKVTYLKAEPMDHTMQQEKLSCDLFRAVGAHVSEADYVNLFINGQYEGVYLDIEPIRSPFKKNKGLDPNGTLIRANTFQHTYGFREIGDLRGDVGSLEQLQSFIDKINFTPRGEFEQFVRQSTDWPRVMDYLALIVLTHRSEIEANDYFFYRSPSSGRWSFIPWDHNNGNFQVHPYGNSMGEPYIHVYPQTIQQLGWQPSYWYVLPSRIFTTPALRREYLDRLEALTKKWLTSGRINSMIEANYERLRDEYPLDPHRWPFNEADPFVSSADQLRRFCQQHARQILDQIKRERNRQPSSLVINEFSFGEKDGWVELHNRGVQPESLSNVQLVTKNEAGNWRLPLRTEPLLRPGEFRVINVAHRPVSIPRFTDAEARERWEMNRWRERASLTFPGFSPDGGFIGLVEQQERRRTDDDDDRDDDDNEDEDRLPETLLDFYFYGPQRAGESYGRSGSGFRHQAPTPNRKNS